MISQKDKITVVTVVFNGEKVIESTINSVLEQDYSNLEYIVIDGLSSDNTAKIVSKYKSQLSKFVSEKDSGVYDAMNKGIDLATGKWILFMNAGDTFYSQASISDFFEHQRNINNEYAVLYGNAEFRLKNIAYTIEASSIVNSNEYMPFSHQAAFTRTDIAKNKKFDLSYKIAADTAFFLRLVKENYKFLHIPVTVCSYNALEGLSADNELKRSKEIVSLQAKWNNIDPDSPYFKSYIRKAQIKQFIRKLTPEFIWIKLRERAILKNHKSISKIG